MLQFGPEERRNIVHEAYAASGQSDVTAVAKKYGIGRSTIYRWMKEYGADVFGVRKKRGRPKDWTVASKLKIILETQQLNDQELGAYLRNKGLYYSHVVQWKTEVLEELKRDGKKKPEAEAILLKKVRDLEHTIQLKEKALKEATALLVLKKKAELIWPDLGADESESTTEKKSSSLLKKPGATEPE